MHILKLILAIAAIMLGAYGTAYASDKTDVEVASLEISTLVSSPSEYDGRIVAIEGKVKKVHHAFSTSGKPYTLFRLVDSDKHKVGVYTKGRFDIKKGYVLMVMGRFRKERRYLIFRFKNVMKAHDVKLVGLNSQLEPVPMGGAACTPTPWVFSACS